MRGRIVSLSCGIYSINVDGVIYNAPARGLFRNRGIKPLVGDEVEIDSNNLIINTVYNRTSELKRPPIANIDQMLIIESLKEPEFSYLLAFKYLTYANMNNIKAKIILTKVDKQDDLKLISEIKETFKAIDIEVYVVSNKTKEGLKEVRELFSNHISCLIGQSGVGKSSLINAIDKDFERKVGEYSKALGRGKHQTKEVILLPYEGGYIADTPGFSSLELNLYKEELAEFYPGFSEFFTKCYYSNCLHITENKCAVKERIEQGLYPKIAYDCYLKLSEESIYKLRRFER
ncbi:MAG: ribosome small subunit-dependent GTPase A [Bacilli bacterium]|nr:ribosome small subunit-dependent GTPase A [Bacilli bacterium]